MAPKSRACGHGRRPAPLPYSRLRRRTAVQLGATESGTVFTDSDTQFRVLPSGLGRVVGGRHAQLRQPLGPVGRIKHAALVALVSAAPAVRQQGRR